MSDIDREKDRVMEKFEYETPVLIDAAELAAASAQSAGVCITGGGCVVEDK